MPTMPLRGPQILAGTVVLTALTTALAFESVYDVSIRTRQADSLVPAASSPLPRHGPAALDLRLVDSGGVGIPLMPWGTDYSHDRRVFREVILQDPPYVDAAAFRRVEQEWRRYTQRMLTYGNNGIAVPLLLELIDFDRVRMPAGSNDAVYASESQFRSRHAAVRRHFGPLFEWTARQGLQVFLETDMLTLTPPLADHLRRVAPDRSAAGSRGAGIRASDPAVWDVYRAGLDELFEALPSISGLVIRFGEGGRLYNTPGWPYRSEMAVRDAASLRAMLQGLLPVFEETGRTLVLRSWTVGVGPIGRLHIDPRIYDAVLGNIDSPALIVSTKFTAGDFFSYLPLNPTLATGRHRRLIELQARPEFEGFAAFPNFLGAEYARALRALRSANPRVAGTFVFTQSGGPLRAGPRSLYPLHGFWLWGDANVFVASRLAVEPETPVELLVREWATQTFGDNPRVVDAVASALIETREAVLNGFYIRAFAEREVRVPGLELPPLMWIFEWDMVGGWHSLLSLVYRGSRDSVKRAVQEGDAATAIVRRARLRLQAAFAAGGPESCAVCTDALRSFEYQESLFDVLAAWRRAFLSYYRWLDGGSTPAWREWRAGRTRFETAAVNHLARFGDDLDFPAFDLASAKRMVRIADRAAWIRSLAASLPIFLCVLAVRGRIARRSRLPARTSAVVETGRLTWTAALTPWQLDRDPIGLVPGIAVTTISLATVGLLAGALTGFATPWISTGAVLVCAVAAVAFASAATGAARDQGRGRLLVAAVGPLLPGSVLLLGLIAWVGPLGFWYRFWTSAMFRVAFLTILIATILWTASVTLTTRVGDGWYGRLAPWLAGAGAGLIVLTVLLPDGGATLRLLDRPLNVAPATDTMLFALQTYAGVSLDQGGRPALLGVLLLVSGGAMWLRSEGRRG